MRTSHLLQHRDFTERCGGHAVLPRLHADLRALHARARRERVAQRISMEQPAHARPPRVVVRLAAVLCRVCAHGPNRAVLHSSRPRDSAQHTPAAMLLRTRRDTAIPRAAGARARRSRLLERHEATLEAVACLVHDAVCALAELFNLLVPAQPPKRARARRAVDARGSRASARVVPAPAQRTRSQRS